MPRQQTSADPYATQPLKKDKSAGLLRGAILVGLLAAGGAVAYTVMQTPAPQTASIEDQQPAPQQLADGSYAVAPSPTTTAPEASPAPAPAPAHRESARRSAPRESAPSAETPAPEAPTITPVPSTPVPAQPLPPPDVSPSASGE